MAEKMSMLIVVVDLDCHKCYHKMRKILCQLQDHERIRTISFDTKSKTVTIVGPFDPQRLACKIRCKGGKVVRDVHIVDTTINGGGKPPPESMADGGPPPPVKTGKNKNKDKQQQPPPPPPVEQQPPPESAPPPGPPPEQTMPPPPSTPVHQHPPPPPDRGMSAMVPQPQYVEEKPPRAELEPVPMSPPPQHMKPPPMDMPMPAPQYHHPPQPEPMKERPPPMMMPAGCPGRPLDMQPVPEYVIPTVEIPSWPAPPIGPCGCPCCAPCYQGYYDSCRCGCCGGRVYGTTVRPLPPACGGYRGCRTFSDDDPSAACSVM